jgi:exosome complex component RRP42
MTAVLHQTLSHASLHPPNLGILPGKKSWLLNLDLVVLADAGNVYDALFMAARAALWDTKVPRTRSVEYKSMKRRTRGTQGVSAGSGGGGDMEDTFSGFDTQQIQAASDFELPDDWDEGEVLGCRDRWPVCVTLNVVRNLVSDHLTCCVVASCSLPRCDLNGEASTPLRLLLLFSFTPSQPPNIQAMRLCGTGELKLAEIKELVKVCLFDKFYFSDRWIYF